jgi:RNA polymerase sigma factor (sigma-70 family)
MPIEAQEELARLLEEVTNGNKEAERALFELVYDELKKMAHRKVINEPPGHTLGTTEVVHEVYIRLVKDRNVFSQNRSYFFGAAARAMHQLLVEHARKAQRKCDLRLMSSVNDLSGVPKAGKSLVILAVVGRALHFRIFNRHGRKVVDTDEKSLESQTRKIHDLRRRLEGLWPPHKLTRSEKVYVIDAVTSIVGYIHQLYTYEYESDIIEEIADEVETLTRADLIDLMDALDELERVEEYGPRWHEVVCLRFWSGWTNEEIRKHLDVCLATVENDWRIARAWLYRRLKGRSIDA